MAKMYYSEEETCQALGVDMNGLMELVNSRQLQMYQDGAKHVYKAGDVDALVQQQKGSAAPSDTGEIKLADDTKIAASSPPPPPRKDDTVITAEGISIFDDEDLEIEEADPMAETQIAPSLDDQIALDGVGSGSGLLDLTRESDDTSLGAEVLDHIDMEGSGIGSGLGTGLSGALGSSGIGSGLAETEPGSGLGTGASMGRAEAMVAEPPTFVEAIDPSSGFFGGLVVGAAVIMLVVTVSAALAAMQGVVSGLLEAMQKNLPIVLAVMAIATGAAGAAGYMLGKAFMTQQRALQRTS
jgi:hypothetical protein